MVETALNRHARSKRNFWLVGIAEPSGAAYAWAANPKGQNLYGSDGQPASPFLADEQSREPVR